MAPVSDSIPPDSLILPGLHAVSVVPQADGVAKVTITLGPSSVASVLPISIGPAISTAVTQIPALLGAMKSLEVVANSDGTVNLVLAFDWKALIAAFMQILPLILQIFFPTPTPKQS